MRFLILLLAIAPAVFCQTRRVTETYDGARQNYIAQAIEQEADGAVSRSSAVSGARVGLRLGYSSSTAVTIGVGGAVLHSKYVEVAEAKTAAMPTGATTATWYYVYLDGSRTAEITTVPPESAGIGRNSTAMKVYLGAVYNDATGALLEFEQFGDRTIFAVPQEASLSGGAFPDTTYRVAASPGGATAHCPPGGVALLSWMTAVTGGAGGVNLSVHLRREGSSDDSYFNLLNGVTTWTNYQSTSAMMKVDASSSFDYCQLLNGGSIGTIATYIWTVGFIDPWLP